MTPEEKKAQTKLNIPQNKSKDEPKQKRKDVQEKSFEELKAEQVSRDTATTLKFVGLIAFFAMMALGIFLAWPYVADLFQEGGVTRVIEEVQNAGTSGVFILLGMQFLQIVVAVIPGEITQVAAGMLYGPWFGALILIAGCVISSAFIYQVVHRLGAPFVQSMVPIKYLAKFREFEAKGRLNMTVFILFLIPGLPKDVFTYLVPLTDMRMKDFLVISNVGRIPGIIVTTYAADSLIEGHYARAAIIFAAAALIVVIGIVFRTRILHVVENIHLKFGDKKDRVKDKRQQKKSEKDS